MNITTTVQTKIELPDTGRRMWKINDDWSNTKGRSAPRQILTLTADAEDREAAVSNALDALRQLRGAVTREIDRIEATR